MTTITAGDAHVAVQSDDAAEKKGVQENGTKEDEEEKKRSEGGFKYFLVSCTDYRNPSKERRQTDWADSASSRTMTGKDGR